MFEVEPPVFLPKSQHHKLASADIHCSSLQISWQAKHWQYSKTWDHRECCKALKILSDTFESCFEMWKLHTVRTKFLLNLPVHHYKCVKCSKYTNVSRHALHNLTSVCECNVFSPRLLRPGELEVWCTPIPQSCAHHFSQIQPSNSRPEIQRSDFLHL